VRQKRNSIIIGLMFGMAGFLLFAGISPGTQAKQKAVLKIQKEKPAEPTKKPTEEIGDEERGEIKGPSDKDKAAYFYNPTNKVDPFKSFIVIKKELEEKREQEKPRTYLETLDISQVTISAIVIGSEDKWALVRDSKGEGHVIKVGTPIGRKRGRVIKILDKEVIVREFDIDIRGRETEKEISIRLPEVE